MTLTKIHYGSLAEITRYVSNLKTREDNLMNQADELRRERNKLETILTQTSELKSILSLVEAGYLTGENLSTIDKMKILEIRQMKFDSVEVENV